jgi:hypothetical protein
VTLPRVSQEECPWEPYLLALGRRALNQGLGCDGPPASRSRCPPASSPCRSRRSCSSWPGGQALSIPRRASGGLSRHPRQPHGESCGARRRGPRRLRHAMDVVVARHPGPFVLIVWRSWQRMTTVRRSVTAESRQSGKSVIGRLEPKPRLLERRNSGRCGRRIVRGSTSARFMRSRARAVGSSLI